MSSIICPECGHDNQPDALYCDECGIDLPVASPVVPPLVGEVESVVVVEEKETEAVIAESQVEEAVSEAPEIEAETEELTTESQVEEAVSEAPEIEESLALVSEEESMSEAIIPEAVAPEEVETIAVTEPVEPTPYIPVSSATVLDLDEPEIIPAPVEPPPVIVPHVFLVHAETESRFAVPCDESLVYLGKINEEMPIQIDLSGLPDADVISRIHAVIHVEEENYYLEDAGSLNGTSLNGESVKPGARFRKQLNTGDIITLGRHRTINLTFEIEDVN